MSQRFQMTVHCVGNGPDQLLYLFKGKDFDYLVQVLAQHVCTPAIPGHGSYRITIDVKEELEGQ